MTEETTTDQLAEIEGQATEYTPREGWRVVQFGEPLRGGDEYDSGLNRYVRRIESQPQLQPETTTEQLAEIEGQGESTPATEYTPPEGWRVVRYGEQLLPGDVWVSHDGTEQRSNILQWDASAVSGGRCIRRIKPQPQPQPQPEPEPQPHAAAIEELRSEVSYVQRLLGESRQRVTQLEELVDSLRTINEAQEKAFEAASRQNDAIRVQMQILQREADKKNSRIEFLETLNAGNGAAIGDYRANVEKLQGLLDTARGQLETAATERDSLSSQLAAVKTELASVAADRYRLQIELDAAQQVPADSPELRQLRADLAEVGHDRDMYRHAHELLVNDVNATHARTKAMTVEAISEWLQPIRAVDNEHLANETLQHLPQIMRHLTGLDREEIE